VIAHLIRTFAKLICSTCPLPADIYSLSLHDALPISRAMARWKSVSCCMKPASLGASADRRQALSMRATSRGPAACPPRLRATQRSEEHTSELQSRGQLVCRPLLEKKKKQSGRGRSHP